MEPPFFFFLFPLQNKPLVSLLFFQKENCTEDGAALFLGLMGHPIRLMGPRVGEWKVEVDVTLGLP